VVLGEPAREVAVRAIRHALVEVHGIEVLAIAVGATHGHLLARFPREPGPDAVRYFVGIAKKESAKRLVEMGQAQRGGVWAKRGKIVRVTDRAHQVRVVGYILDHLREGAAVWSFRDEQKPTD
jgi:REP element-mobilizing transposase RayT